MKLKEKIDNFIEKINYDPKCSKNICKFAIAISATFIGLIYLHGLIKSELIEDFGNEFMKIWNVFGFGDLTFGGFMLYFILALVFIGGISAIKK